MEHNIKIEVKDLGKAVGTLGWVEKRLATASVEIVPCKGRLSAYLKYTNPDDGQPRKNKVAEICLTQEQIYEAEEYKDYGYHNFDGRVAYAYASDGEWANIGENRWSVFDVILTDAAIDKVSELMKSIVQNLKDAWKNDKGL